MLISYKYRIYPTKKQEEILAKTFGCVRFVWNKNVETWNNRGTYKSSTEYRNEFEFLKEISSASVQQKEIDFKEFKSQKFNKNRKKKLGNPKFKSKYDKQSFRLPNQKFKLVGNKIQLEKIGKIKIVMDRIPTGKFMSVTVSKDLCGSYYASILSDDIVLQPVKTNNSVGIDVGIKALITTSDGLQIKNLPNNQRKIKHIQRRLAKKKKGSRKYKELKLRLAKLHRTIARKRAWLLHNISKHLVENYDLIVTEDLNVAGMMKNHKLAGSIQRASWSELFRMIEYKCKFYGKEFVKISRWFPSSKMCHKCGAIKDDLTLKDRIYNCDCGFSIDRDLNASLNIKAVGVTTAIQSVMGCKTYSKELSLKQAIPNDLTRFLYKS